VGHQPLFSSDLVSVSSGYGGDIDAVGYYIGVANGGAD